MIVGFATWRLSNLLVNERGPWKLFVRLRELTGIRHDPDGYPQLFSIDNPLVCIYCISVYMAIMLAVLPLWISILLGLSGLAIVFEKVVK